MRGFGAGERGAALGVPATARAGVPAPCDPNGMRCDPATPEHCCTGTCKKRHGKFKCAPAGKAYGCTKKRDYCRGVALETCPDNPAGSQCVIAKKGKLLCVTRVDCAQCDSDADCTSGLGAQTGRCIKGCRFCAETEGIDSACVVPAPPSPPP